jgi:hypothetical protein
MMILRSNTFKHGKQYSAASNYAFSGIKFLSKVSCRYSPQVELSRECGKRRLALER